jgi:tetratricopeptide (TPR) repeat protein
MGYISLASWTFAGLLAVAIPVSAQVIVIGNTNGYHCFIAANTGIEPQQGIGVCNSALKGNQLTARDRAATRVNRGVLYDMVGRYHDAWEDFNASIEIMPKLGEGYLNRGAALMRMGRFDEALVDIEQSMKLGVSRPEVAYYDLAVTEEQLGNVTGAYHDYQRALVQAPGYTLAIAALERFNVARVPSPTETANNN